MLTLEEKLEKALVPVSEQPYAVPDNWVWTRLGEVCIFERGITFPASAKEFEKTAENIPCLRTANVQEELQVDDLLYVDKKYFKNNEKKITKVDDIIMSSANSREKVGKTCYVKNLTQDMTFGGFILTIRPKEISSKYLFYVLRFEYISGHFMGESTQTTNIANLNSTILGNYAFPLPPLAEQTRIVSRIESLFSKLDEARELIESSLNRFEERKSAILHKAFSGELTKQWREENGVGFEWEEKTIRDCVGKINQGWSPKCESTPSLSDKDWGVIKTTAIQHMRFDELENKKLPLSLEPRTKHEIKSGDILITRAGPRVRVGVSCLVEKVRGKLLLCDKAYRFHTLENTDSKFIVAFLNTPTTLGAINKLKTGISDSGVNLTQDGFSNITINLPPLPEQEEIVRILDDVLGKESEAKELLNLLEKIDLMKKAILGRAFRGELGTNREDEESAEGLLREVLGQ